MNILTSLYSAGDPFNSARAFLILSAVWFILAFITRKRSRAASMTLYCIVGLLFFVAGVYGMVLSFLAGDIKRRITIIAVTAVIVLVIAVVLLFATGAFDGIIQNMGSSADDDDNDDEMDRYR